MKLAMVFPGQGSQSVGMLKAYAGLPGVDAVRAEAANGAGRRFPALARRRTGRAAEPDGEYAAGDGDGGDRGLPGVARDRAGRRRRSSPATAWASTPRWWPRARCASAMRCRWCAFARRRCRKPCRKDQGAMAAILGLDDDGARAACAEAAQGEVGAGGEFQCARPGGDRGTQDRGRARHRGLQGARREARDAAAGQRAVPFAA